MPADTKIDIKKIAIPIFSVLVSFILGGIIIKMMGLSPSTAFKALMQGGIGNINALGETFVKATPLVFTALSYAFAYKAGLINIGAEGQLYMGGFLATLVGTNFQGLPMYIHLPLAIIAAFIGGGLWGLVVAWLKVRFNANEIITTVMLNYIAMNWISYLVTGPMKAPPGNYPQSKDILSTALLPNILPGSRLHLGLLLAVLMLIFYYIFFKKTKTGYETRIVGRNRKAADYAGMKSKKLSLLIMFIAGGVAGLAGASEILGIQGRMIEGFSPGYGFDGIAVALLGLNSSFGIGLSAIFFGFLRSGGNMMQMLAQVPVSVISIITGLVIIFVIAGQAISNNRIAGLQKIIDLFKRSEPNNGKHS